MYSSVYYGINSMDGKNVFVLNLGTHLVRVTREDIKWDS